MTEQRRVPPGADTASAPVAGPASAVPDWLQAAAQLAWRALVVVAVTVLAVWVLARLALVTLPLFVATVLATLCVPIARRLERRGLRPGVAAGIVVLGGLAAIAGIIAALAPTFGDQITQLRPTLQTATQQVLGWLQRGPLGWDRADIDRLMAQFGDQVQGSSGEIVSGVVSGAVIVAEAFTAVALVLILLFFFIKDGPGIVDWLIARSPDRHRELVRALGRRSWHALGGYVRGTATIALIDAIGIGLGLLILQVPLVLPLTVLVFLGAFLPVIGAFISGLVAVLVALAAGGLTLALLVLAVVLGVQQLESHVLQPVIMRRAVALHPVIVLIALGVGARVAGIAGAFLAVPVTAVISAVGNELRVRAESRAA